MTLDNIELVFFAVWPTSDWDSVLRWVITTIMHLSLIGQSLNINNVFPTFTRQPDASKPFGAPNDNLYRCQMACSRIWLRFVAKNSCSFHGLWRKGKPGIPEWIYDKEGKLGTYARQGVAAGAHLPTPLLFERAKRPDERADYCLYCSFLPQCKHQILVFTVE